jgi:hypothetical protein
MSDDATTERLCIRDLIQCVQAARDGARSDSLFAMQCDAVLNRVEQVFPDIVVVRAPISRSGRAGLRASLSEPIVRHVLTPDGQNRFSTPP